jgi:polysaccharide biosynthesis protein PslH
MCSICIILEHGGFSIIQIEHIYLCQYIQTIRKYSKARIVLRPQNVEHKIWKGWIKKSFNPAVKIFMRLAVKRLMNYEKQMAAVVDGIITISPPDKEFFRICAPEKQIACIPAGFDFITINDYPTKKNNAGIPVFYYLGSMDWLPNVQGLKWFIMHVMPEARRRYPDFRLHIAGKKMPRWFYKQQDQNLIVDGEIKDSTGYHADKDILIVPLFCGSGIRIKIIEAMALGKAVISTTIGASGIPYTDQLDIMIADNKEEFLLQIGKCLKSQGFYSDIGGKAHKLARANYDHAEIAKKMIKFYDSLLNTTSD